MNSNFSNLIHGYYSASNQFESHFYFSQILDLFRNDFKLALLKNADFPNSNDFSFSGIITYLPGGNKKISKEEEELISKLIINLDLPYDSLHSYKHVSILWKSIVSLIKGASK